MLLGIPLFFFYGCTILVYLVAITWNIYSKQRPLFELHTGFCCIALTYSSWSYMFIFAMFSFADLFKLFSANNGLLWIYAHSFITLASSNFPGLALFPLILLVGRVRRLYEKEITTSLFTTVKNIKPMWYIYPI